MDFVKVDGFQMCMGCGAFAMDAQDIEHYANCDELPEHSENWKDHYAKLRCSNCGTLTPVSDLTAFPTANGNEFYCLACMRS